MFSDFIGLIVKQWIVFLIAFFGSMPWFARAFMGEKLQKRYDDFVNPDRLPYLALFCIIISLFFASYNIWKVEKEKNIALLKEKEEINKPNFSININMFFTGNVENLNSSELYVNLSIKNIGMQSIAYGWKIKISSDEIGEIFLMPNYIEDNYTLMHNGENIITFNKDNRIEDKAMSPIQKGGMIGGWLRFICEGITAEQLLKANKTIYVKDILENEYEKLFTRGEIKNKKLYYPGTGGNPFSTKKIN